MVYPAHSPVLGAKALALSATAAVARNARLDRLYARANRPLMELAEMQPVTAAWWRERRKVRGDFWYLALGDSTAQGIGASTPGRSYVGQLTDRIEAELGRAIAVTNLGVSGAPTRLCVRDQLPRAEKLLARRVPALVTLAIGANDIAEWDARAFHTNIRTIFDALPAHTIVGEVPCFHLPWNDRKVREANRILHTIAADRGLTVVPLYEATRRRGIRGILTEFAPDAFHPTDRGYEVWADTFWPAVRAQILRESLVPAPGAGPADPGPASVDPASPNPAGPDLASPGPAAIDG
ncbi:GDSL-type esterase/lipase family protein [Leucobacter chromiireducens]|uniref:SGNH/GDSL hydrolase family protein n=1 Tax=Leucobacter chromiireducens subsp. solipictus TaxID=398235 RepID=A0ABS1SH54_9MICO|nr:SGNH/GDSL hydrolase family protein [Leucobacter chromiireducens subsp. solipictus]